MAKVDLVSFDAVLKEWYPAPWDPPWKHWWAAFRWSWWALGDVIEHGDTSWAQRQARIDRDIAETMGWER